MKHYLVDFENVSDAGLRQIGATDKDCCIHIFFSAVTAKISLEYLNLLQYSTVKAHRVDAGTNALDVHMATYLGYVIGMDSNHEDSFYLVSSNHDFSELVKFWNHRGVKVETITIRKRPEEQLQLRSVRPSSQAPLRAASAVPRPVQVRPVQSRPVQMQKSAPEAKPAERPVHTPVYTKPVRVEEAKAAPAVSEKTIKAEPVRHEPEKKAESTQKSAQVSAPAAETRHIKPESAPEVPKTPVKVIVSRNRDNVLSISTDRPDDDVFTEDVLRFINSVLENRADDPNLKQIVYMNSVTKYGQKKGLAIYRQIKDIF